MGGPKSPIQIKLESRLLQAQTGTSFRRLRLDNEATPSQKKAKIAEERKIKAKRHLEKVKYVVQRNQLTNQFKQLKILRRLEERIKSAEKRRIVNMQKICIKAAALRRGYFHRDKYRRESQQKESLYHSRLRKAKERREKYLTSIVQRASRDTKRVEKILQADANAKLMHKRKLDSKLHSAERRRKKYILDIRSKKAKLDNDRVDHVSTKLKNTKALQLWWRRVARMSRVARSLRKSNMCSAYETIFKHNFAVNSSEGFESLSLELAKSTTVAKARAIIRSLRLAKTSRAANPRILLASTMINSFPNDVLGGEAEGTRHPLALRLQHASKRFDLLLGKVTNWIGEVNEAKHSIGARLFSEARTTYIYFVGRFIEWKKDDAKRLAYGMMGAYIDISKQHAFYDSQKGEENDPFLEQICTGYERQLATIQAKVKGLIGAEGAAAWLSVAVATIERNGTSASNVTGEKPPSNEQMMHDAILSDTYELQRQKPSASPEAMNILARELESKNFDRLIGLLEHVRGRIAALVPSRRDLHKELEERIDVELIHSQLSNGVFGSRGARGLVSYIGNQLAALQSAAKEASVKDWLKGALESLTDDGWVPRVPKILNDVLSMLSELELDVANVQLKVLRSQLRGQRGYDYELSKFDAFVKEREIPIDEVTRMPPGCSAMLRAMLQKHGRQEVRVLIMNHLLARIIEGKTGVVETLRLDEEKLQSMRADLVDITQRASLSILLRQFFSDASAPARYAHKLSTQTCALNEEAFIAEMMADDSLKSKSKAMLRSLVGGKGRQVIEKSLQRHIRGLLVKAVKNKSANFPSSELKSMGLDFWHERIASTAKAFTSLEEHHFCTFRSRYVRALRTLSL